MEKVTPEGINLKRVEAVSGKSKENLKQRAYLNTLTSMIDYACTQIVGFLISPFLIGQLGSSMYGVWKMISQMTGYASLADSRATQVLKWTVAKKKDVVSTDELRSDVSSAFFVIASILPLIFLFGGVISWYAPYITNVDAKYYTLIRITCSLLILSLTISRVFDLFESVLRGMNLGYKRMGFRAVIVLCGGALKVLALTFGYGLIGLSIVQVSIAFITGFTFYYTVRKHVYWFGFGRTNFKKIWAFTKLSGWNMANNTVDTLLTNTDKVLLGFISGPVLVSSYVLTSFLPLAIQGFISKLIIGIMPGIGKLLGIGDYNKIETVRGIINNLILLLTTGAGVVIILFNQAFLYFWVGSQHYSGNLVNTLIVLMILQDTFIKHDGYFITATQDLKRKVCLTAMAAIVFIGLSFIMIREFEIAGLVISVIGAKFLLFVGQRAFIKNKIRVGSSFNIHHIKTLCLSITLLLLAEYFSNYIQVVSFFHLIWLCPCVFCITVASLYFIGLHYKQRQEIVHTFSTLKYFKSN
jgi:O-antigen/teichoic acid export membrane protein